MTQQTSVLTNTEQYFMYGPLIKNGKMDILVSDITSETFIAFFSGIMNIFRDGIETEEVQNMFVTVIFDDGQRLELHVIDYFYNLIMWKEFIDINKSIEPHMLYFPDYITQGAIKTYIDKVFLEKYRDERNILEEEGYDPETANIILNRCVDNAAYGYNYVDEFSWYLMNTINLKDDIDLWKKNPRYYELLHTDMSSVPIEQVKDVGMRLTEEAIDIISHSDHCLADSFLAKQGINPKQFREYQINEGPKPDGQGSVFPIVINNSFINGGVSNIKYFMVESASGRLAQIIAKCNVGTSGAFARILGLNNRDSMLHKDPKYVCNSKHFEEINMEDDGYLTSFEGRYYRTDPNGEEKCLTTRDKHLVGKKLYFRSPMKCASAAAGKGICYRCYGKLAYTNASINIGQYAAENLSSKLTQKQLSAKHLLEAMILALDWVEEFFKFFEVSFNMVKLREDEDVNYEGCYILINPDDIQLMSEEDDYQYNEYVNEFKVRDKDGNIFSIHSKNGDAMYISNDLNEKIRSLSNDIVEGDHMAIPMEILSNEDPIFLIRLTNNDFSATLNRISSIINLKAITTSFNSHELLQEFNNAVRDGKLDITSVHLEVILMNQIRNAYDVLDTPDWSKVDEPYQILPLSKALSDNPSITVSMTYQLTNVCYNPLSFRKNKPSYLDLLFMEKPQEFFNNKGLVKKPKPNPKKKPINLIRRMKEGEKQNV